MNLQGKHQDDARVVASVTTTSGAKSAVTTAAVKLPGMVNGYVFILDVTAAATDAGDTLDVAVQTLVDGTNYVDVVAFTQCTGSGGAKRHIAKINADTAQAMFEVGAALTAGNIRNILGDAWRVKYTQVDANSNGSFTFKVTALPM